MDYVPTYEVTLTDAERIALKIALSRSLTEYRDNPPFFNIETSPANSTIGMQRDLLAGLEAIGLGNRRGSDKFDIRMVRAPVETATGFTLDFYLYGVKRPKGMSDDVLRPILQNNSFAATLAALAAWELSK